VTAWAVGRSVGRPNFVCSPSNGSRCGQRQEIWQDEWRFTGRPFFFFRSRRSKKGERIGWPDDMALDNFFSFWTVIFLTIFILFGRAPPFPINDAVRADQDMFC
jgi:hypothetical protein